MIENFAQNLVRLRMKNGISQKELATELDISPQTISNIEKQVAYPTFSNLEKIAKFFNATPVDLFGNPTELAMEDSMFKIDEYSQKANAILKSTNYIERLFDDEEAQVLISQLYVLQNGKQIFKDGYPVIREIGTGTQYVLTPELEYTIDFNYEFVFGDNIIDVLENAEKRISRILEDIENIKGFEDKRSY